MEAVILSVPASYVSLLAKEGRKSGRLLAQLHKHIDRPLAAILTVNTLANTVGAVGVGHQVHVLYGDGFLAVTSGIMTLVILIVSEIFPKTLGAVKSKTLAPYAAYVITGMIYITYPFVAASRKINEIVAGKRVRRTTREEMIAAAEISADEGVIQQRESRIIKNLLMLDRIEISEIMTPRSVVNAFDMNETVGDIMEKYKPVRFSRIPLFDSDLDHVKGLLHRYKLMEAVSHDMYNMPLKDIMTPIFTVAEDMSVSQALDLFIKRREHLFLVVDEYGTMSGIVTLEDAIETLLGVEIVDSFDSITDMRQYALEQWRLKKQALLKRS